MNGDCRRLRGRSKQRPYRSFLLQLTVGVSGLRTDRKSQKSRRGAGATKTGQGVAH
jgi:hypothetical protein